MLDTISLLLTIIGGVNWLLVGVFQFDLVAWIFGGQGALRLRFLDLGLIPGTKVTLIKVAPMGDPIEIRLRGYELTLRLDEAAWIEVKNA